MTNHIQRNIQDRTAILTFDREGSSANIFDQATLLELKKHLQFLQSQSHLDGLIITSAKPRIFIAGADLKSLSEANPEEMETLISLGQNVFQMIANLPFITIAAIHGACVGGGYELALACDWRVATNASSTRIGLPETKLGILPAWGGSTLLPRLIGLPKALPLILSGKVMKAPLARKKGLIDHLVPETTLLSEAKKLLTKKPHRKRPSSFWHSLPMRKIIARKARQSILEKTRGHYPGPLLAIEVVTKGISESVAQSLQREKDAIIHLTQLPETKELVRLFFLSEASKKKSVPGVLPTEISQVGVIGSGIMGAGMSYWLSSRKLPVTMKDLNHEALARGMNSIQKEYKKSVKKRILSPSEAQSNLDRISAVTGDISLHHCDLIIEAAVENLDIKKKIFADLSSRTRPDTVLATNTSALPIHELANEISNPERLVGLHFFNPVSRMPLVEVVRTPSCSDQTLATVLSFVQKIGKLPIVVADQPGFLVNRVLLPYLVRAGELFEEGYSPEQLDQCMLDFGMPMGPIRLLDEIGLDVGLHVAQTLSAAFPDRMRIPSFLTTMVHEGALGKKSGKGFYLYDHGKIAGVNPSTLIHKEPSNPAASPQDELVKMMVEESDRCLQDKVVESADELDFAMIMGTGFAPFRGGPIQYGKQRGWIS